MSDEDVSRRGFLRSSGGGVVAAEGLATGERVGRRVEGRDIQYQRETSDAVSVAPGGESDLSVSVPVDEDAPVDKVDILFCFDLTSSMSDEVNVMKDRAQTIMQQIAGRSLDAAFGVAGFMDYVGVYDSYGYDARYGTEGDTPWTVVQAISPEFDRTESAIDSLELGDGEDSPESYTRVLHEVEHGDVGWRDNALRLVVLFGDSIPHDDDFHAEADEWGTYVDTSTGTDPGRDEQLFTGDDLDFQSVVEDLDIPVLAVNSGTHTAAMRYIAAETGGAYYDLENAEQIPERVVELVRTASEEVSLTLDPEPGYEGWFSWSPTVHEAVTAGTTEEFDVTVSPPSDAPLGIQTVSLYAIADGSRIETFDFEVNVYGDTTRSVSTRKMSGAGPNIDRRLALYEWYRSSFEREFWLQEGVAKLERFREHVRPEMSDLGTDIAAEVAGAGYYSDAVTAAQGIVTLSGTLEAWGTGRIQNRARNNIPRSKTRRLEVSDPAAQVERIQSLFRDIVESSDSDGTRGTILEEIDALLEYLRAWRTEVENIDVETDYKPVMDREESTMTLPAEEGAEQTAAFTAGEATQTISWQVSENGWLPRYGTYAVTVELVGKGTETVETNANSGAIRLLGNPSFGTPEEGDEIRVTVAVEEPPKALFTLWTGEVTEIDVSIGMNYDFRIVEDDAPDSDVRNLTEQMRAANRENARRHLTSAIEFFADERRLLSPRNAVSAAVASPVDLHVEGETGHLGAVYDGNDVRGIEVGLQTDFAYSGPSTEPEGVALLDSSGEFDVSVVGRGEGVYDLEVISVTWTSDELETETISSVSEVPVDPDVEDVFQVDVSRAGGDQSVDADLSQIEARKQEARSPVTVPTLPIPVGALVGGGVLGLLLALLRYTRDG